MACFLGNIFFIWVWWCVVTETFLSVLSDKCLCPSGRSQWWGFIKKFLVKLRGFGLLRCCLLNKVTTFWFFCPIASRVKTDTSEPLESIPGGKCLRPLFGKFLLDYSKKRTIMFAVFQVLTCNSSSFSRVRYLHLLNNKKFQTKVALSLNRICCPYWMLSSFYPCLFGVFLCEALGVCLYCKALLYQ